MENWHFSFVDWNFVKQIQLCSRNCFFGTHTVHVHSGSAWIFSVLIHQIAVLQRTKWQNDMRDMKWHKIYWWNFFRLLKTCLLFFATVMNLKWANKFTQVVILVYELASLRARLSKQCVLHFNHRTFFILIENGLWQFSFIWEAIIVLSLEVTSCSVDCVFSLLSREKKRNW